MKLDGGCLCGAVRFRADVEPALVAVCHCATCQRTTGSSFCYNVTVPESAVTVEGDTLTTYEDRSGASGEPFHRSFCGRCGSPIMARGAAYGGLVILEAGALDDPASVVPGAHIWCAEKQPWVVIPEGATCFDGNPG